MTSVESLIDCYHELILHEYERMEDCSFILDDARSRLNNDEVDKIASSHGLTLKELLSEGLLVKYPDSTFRTQHFDLIYRAVNVKAAVWSPKISLEFKIPKPREDYLPSFTEVPLEEIEKIAKLKRELAEMLIEALHESEYKGLAYHQHYFLQKIMEKKHKCYLLVAPTASGKSLIFYLVILAEVLSKLSEKGTKAIVLYPRKALASDQLFKFLRVICAINPRLREKDFRKITIGIDDGDTPRTNRAPEVRKGNVFRGIRCLYCDSPLTYRAEKDKTLVVCKKCKIFYDEILASKEDIWSASPDIVLSNLSALNRRMMMVPSQDLVGGTVRWVVLDDAHTYREELGGHARWLLRRLDARFDVLRKGDVRFILSSATIPKPVRFASKLIGIQPNQIHYEDYGTVIKSAKHKYRKLTLDVILAPNPLRSAESLAEELALLFGVWGRTNSKKAVLFVDNVSEVERIHDFVVETIILERAEHNDHINPTITSSVQDIATPFSWLSITKGTTNIDKTALVKIYDFHYAERSPEVRAEVEERFKSQPCGLLFSTSTLELGIDIGDIAAIIQYKVPLTSESYIQRVGRAGRSNRVLRVALGMLILTNSPSQVRYVLGNEYLRLIDPEKIDPYIEIPIAWENEEIKRQHMTFSILDVLASKGRATYLDFLTEVRDSWSDIQDVVSSVKNLLIAAKENLSTLKEYAFKISGDRLDQSKLERLIEKIMKKIVASEERLRKVEARSIEEGLTKLRKGDTEITAAIRALRDIRMHVEEILTGLRLPELENYNRRLLELENSLREVLSGLEKIGR